MDVAVITFKQPQPKKLEISDSVIALLSLAAEALESDQDSARRCIAHATTLLRSDDFAGIAPPVAKAPASGGLAPWQMSRVKAYIEQNLGTNITVNDLSSVARVSAGHFSRAFKRSIGVSPHAFILRRRIAYAQRLMLTTQAPLCQIALDCGLSDQSHFSRLFRRTTGSSPNAWRRRTQSGPVEVLS